jgi:hypothetical protein
VKLNLGNVSTEIATRAIQTLYEEESSVGAPGGASAADLGVLPKIGIPRVKVKNPYIDYEDEDEA